MEQFNDKLDLWASIEQWNQLQKTHYFLVHTKHLQTMIKRQELIHFKGLKHYPNIF